MGRSARFPGHPPGALKGFKSLQSPQSIRRSEPLFGGAFGVVGSTGGAAPISSEVKKAPAGPRQRYPAGGKRDGPAANSGASPRDRCRAALEPPSEGER